MIPLHLAGLGWPWLIVGALLLIAVALAALRRPPE